MSILDNITSDLDWREKELASMRIILIGKDATKTQKAVLLRAAWAMLYAHYEGFMKFALTLFFDEVAKRTTQCGNLPAVTKIFALRKAVKALRNVPESDAIEEIICFDAKYLSVPPQFPEIETNSNLWPKTLAELLNTADISPEIVIKNEAKLNTLVSRRNSIAHGEKNFIAEVSYYLGFEHAVYEVMYDVAFQIEKRLSIPPYHAQQSGEPDCSTAAVHD